jgi:MOSC domain-containing protein YiiM
MPRLLSVNAGLPRDVTWNGKTVRTSVWKSPVTGRRMVRKLGIDGDAQADLAGAERITVASSEELRRALRIPALSKGWQSSFQAMLQQDLQQGLSSKTTMGNLGLAYEEQAPGTPRGLEWG